MNIKDHEEKEDKEGDIFASESPKMRLDNNSFHKPVLLSQRDTVASFSLRMNLETSNRTF